MDFQMPRRLIPSLDLLLYKETNLLVGVPKMSRPTRVLAMTRILC
jgi:hypothetical protein